ncbi:MAG: EthD domain-containing protein, partial [Ilumatobacteraceae bacterium]
AGTTRDEFRRHWAEVHAPLALAHPDVFGITRYVQVHSPDDAESYPPAATRGAPAPFDGLAEVYSEKVTPDPDAAAPIYADMAADTASFIDREHSPGCLGRVDVIIDR